MKKLYIMMGCPASGKSTWVKEMQKKQDGIIVSRDEIRFKLISDTDEYFAKEQKVFEEYIRSIQKALDSGPNAIVYADATHIYSMSRTKLLSQLDLKDIELYAVTFKVDLLTVLKRNGLRTGRAHVPSKTIRRMYYSFENPINDKWNYKAIIEVGDDTHGNLANI